MNSTIEQNTLYEEHKVEINKALRSQWILWIGIIGTPIVLIIMCQGFGDRIREEIPQNPSFPIQIFRTVLIIVGVFMLVLSYGIRKYFFSARFKGFDTKRWKPKMRNRDPEYIIAFKQRNYFPMVIPSSLSIFGFLLFIMGDSLGVFYAFAIVSLLGTLYQRPQKKDVLALCNHFLQNQNSVEMEKK
jgi:hypothetical protein